MRLLDYLDAGSIAVGLASSDKTTALETLVDLVVRRGLVKDAAALLQAIRSRENIVSTGVGNGIAMPHADVPEITVPRLALAVFPQGVDFEALDEEPVYVVFLLLGTPRTPGLHMKILARIARLSKDPDFFRGLREASSVETVLATLDLIESRH